MKLFSANQPVVSSVLYVIAIPTILSLGCYFSFDWIVENDHEGHLFWLLLIILPINHLYLNKAIRFVDKSTTIRPLTPSESIFVFFAYSLIVAYSQDFIFSADSEETLAYMFISSFSLCLIGIIVNFRVQKVTFSSVGSVNDDDLQTITEKAIRSDAFLSALQTTLPAKSSASETDQHFPFILSVINKRRNSYQKTSQLFFIALIVFALISTSLITIYGFILIDQQTIGAAKTIQNVEKNLRLLEPSRIDFYSINRSLTYYERVLIDEIMDIYGSLDALKDKNEILYKHVKPYTFFNDTSTDRVRLPTDADPNFQISLQNRISSFKKISAILINETKKTNADLEMNRRIKDFTPRLERFLKIADDYENEINDLFKDYSDGREVLLGKIADAKKEVATDESRLYSLLKRLSVGIIIGSFFIAVLKYLANQYQFHLNRLHEAELDEVKVRKFYIAYNVAGDTKGIELLDSFLKEGSNDKSFQTAVIPASQSLDDGDKKIISEILSILKKKI